MTTLYLCGAGNSEGVRLALTVNRARPSWDRVLLLDDDPGKCGKVLLGVPVVGPIGLLDDAPSGSAAVNLVARTTEGRAAVHRRLVASGVALPNLVHPGVDAGDCELGRGVLVYEQAVLSPETRLGDSACVFMRAVIGHEATVGAGCVVAAGAVLNARVALAERVYVGSNASVLPEVDVGAGATVGANTMVAIDVPDGATIVGVPGQILAAARGSAAATSSPGPLALAPVAERQREQAAAALEARLVAVLREVLGREDAGATDRFFDVGGTSLHAVRFTTAVRASLDLELPLGVLYARCTMRELARHLLGTVASSAAAGQARARALARRRPGGSGPQFG